jgi:hypothetical protein
MALAPSGGRHLYDLEARDLSLIGRGLRQRLHPDVWRRATLAQREEMTRAAHAYIRGGFGLDPKSLQLADGWPAFLHGHFDPRTKEICVNARLLKAHDPTPLLEALAHENRHAVQQERMEGKQAVPYSEQTGHGEVDAWIAASGTYTQNEYVDYHYNALEVDAREAANSVVDGGFWAEHRRLLEERMAEVGR